MTDLLKRVYALMGDAGLKPTQLAKELNLSTSTFTDWGKGKGSPSLKAVMQFSEYFGVSLDYLVYGKEDPVTVPVEFMSKEDKELLDSFHRLSPEMRIKVIGYIEGMLSSMPEPTSDEERQKLLI